MVTGAWSCGTNDRAENEKNYLEMALDILHLVHNEEESPFEMVAAANK